MSEPLGNFDGSFHFLFKVDSVLISASRNHTGFTLELLEEVNISTKLVPG